jgi:molybdenum cofactor sulfurtransferase
MMPLSFVSYCAAKYNISLRTGCMCNPGGAAALLGIKTYMEQLAEGTRLRELEQRVGHELGVVRISLGLGSNWDDVHDVARFARKMLDEEERTFLIAEWEASG